MCALLAAGCAAPGTDVEALPFYREDRTHPAGHVFVDIPFALTNADARQVPAGEDAPSREGATTDAEEYEDTGEGPEEETEEETEEHLLVRTPWPLGAWYHQGARSSYRLTLTAAAETELADAGPVGRGLSAETEVRDDLVPNLASDPASGGLSALPLYFYDDEIDHNAIPDTSDAPDLDRDIGLLPFFAYGTGTRDDEDYLAVFPFGGKTKGLLGKEEITWYGFPYPVYAKVRDRAYDSTHVMFPFVNWIDGPRHEGFRVLPFYGHYRHTDLSGDLVYERTYLMWPFFTWQRTGLNEERGPTETFFAFPFYGHVDAPERDIWSVLWPFFKYTDDRRRERWELRAPFPFLLIGGGKDRWKLDLWPLFGAKRRADFFRWFAVWPIWRYESLENESRRFDGQWFLPFFWRTRWVNRETGEEEEKIRVYPLLHYRESKAGSVDFAMLSPFWEDDPKGFERILGPLFRLYRYHRDPWGGVEHQALFGLFSWRDLPRTGGRPAYTRLSLLFGLFQYRQLGAESGLRLFWLPEITWGGEP